MMVRVHNEGGVFSLESVQSYKPSEGLASERQETPIFILGHLFAILPEHVRPLRNQFVCCHPDDCRTFVWSSGKTHRFGLGPYLVADDKFYILSDDGVLTVLDTSTRGFVPLAEAKVLEGGGCLGTYGYRSGPSASAGFPAVDLPGCQSPVRKERWKSETARTGI